MRSCRVQPGRCPGSPPKTSRAGLHALVTGIALVTAIAVLAAQPVIPPAYGPYTRLGTNDFADALSFKSSDRIVGTYYFYWYDAPSKMHIVNGEDGSDGLTDHPPGLEDFSYKSVSWHERQLRDMEEAGIDVLLAVFWGAPSEHGEKASLHWSYAGLAPLVRAREQLLSQGRRPPRLGLFYDTSTLRHNGWNQHVDLTTDYGKRWFYATVRVFFSCIPPRHWAMIDDKPIVLLYGASFARNHNQEFVDFTKTEFKREFGGREPYLAPQDSWRVKADNVCAWGGALGTRNPGIGELGPGYDDSAVYGRTSQIAKREGGKFYEKNWMQFLRRPSHFVMIETWNEFHEGTDICESKEYGRQYIGLTRKYSDLFRKGWMPPWPQGPFTGSNAVTLTPDTAPSAGLRLLSAEDGRTTLETEAGWKCWRAKAGAGNVAYIYLQADDSFKWSRAMNAEVTVEYLDAAPGRLGVQYDGSDPAAPFRGAYSSAASIPLKGDRQWKTARFQLKDAVFLNSQNAGADFRLVADAAEILVRKVALSRR